MRVWDFEEVIVHICLDFLVFLRVDLHLFRYIHTGACIAGPFLCGGGCQTKFPQSFPFVNKTRSLMILKTNRKINFNFE